MMVKLSFQTIKNSVTVDKFILILELVWGKCSCWFRLKRNWLVSLYLTWISVGTWPTALHDCSITSLYHTLASELHTTKNVCPRIVIRIVRYIQVGHSSWKRLSLIIISCGNQLIYLLSLHLRDVLPAWKNIK